MWMVMTIERKEEWSIDRFPAFSAWDMFLFCSDETQRGISDRTTNNDDDR